MNETGRNRNKFCKQQQQKKRFQRNNALIDTKKWNAFHCRRYRNKVYQE